LFGLLQRCYSVYGALHPKCMLLELISAAAGIGYLPGRRSRIGISTSRSSQLAYQSAPQHQADLDGLD